MKALIYGKDKTLSCGDIEEPSIQKDDEVLIKIRATGICGTDIHILGQEYTAKPGVVLGHESTGIVEAVGRNVKNVRPGDAVALDPTFHCGTCTYCLTDRPNYCAQKSSTETGVSSNGTFAPLHVANASFVHLLPENVSFTLGTLTEPLACVLNAFEQTKIGIHSRVLVVGGGPMGLLAALTAQHMGCSVTVGEIDPFRVRSAQKMCEDVQDYSTDSIEDMNEDRLYDIIVDTSGKMLGRLLPLADRGGDILLLGLDYSYSFDLQPSLLTDRGVRLVGSIDSNCTILPSLQLLNRHADYEKIITHELPLEEYGAAFALLGLNLDTNERGPIHANKIVLAPA